MVKKRKNYFKKPVGSVAVLGYYVVVPFYNRSAQLPQLEKMTKGAAGIIAESIQYACAEIQASFIVGEELYDDGIVEMHAVVSETHVSIYMKLPATISIHSAISQVRIFSSKFLLKTQLKEYKDTYNSLYSSNYLAMCEAIDTSKFNVIPGSAYTQYLKAFFLENDLAGDSQNMHQIRAATLGKSSFMSDQVTFYK